MAQVIASYSGRPAFQLRYDVTQTSVSTGTNQSTVSWHVYAICVDASYDSYNLTGGSYAVYMDGVLIASGTKALDFRNSYYGQVISIASGSRVLNHAANGTKTASFSASHTAGSPFGTASTPTGYHNATTINRVPGAPTIGTITDITSSGASVPWSGAVANGGNAITTYNYRVGTTSGGSDVATGQDSASPLPLSELTRKTTYYVQVQAVSATGVVSAWSAAKSFTTLAEVPTIASTYSMTSITRNSATTTGVSVTDNGGEAPSNVRVEYNTSASSAGSTTVARGSWGDVTLTGLSALTTYWYRAAVANSAGWSTPGPWKSFTTLSDAPDDMAPPTFSAVTNTSFTAEWVAPNMNGATFVAYQWALSLSPTFATVVATGTTSSLSRAFTGLTPGTRYYFRVRANATPNNGGYGVANQLTTGIAPNSGLRMYAVKDITGYQQVSVARTNLCTNPTFHGEDASAWGHYAGVGGAATATVENDGGYSGAYYRRVTWTTASTSGGGQYHADAPGSHTPGQTYAFSGYIRPSTTRAFTCLVQWYDDALNPIAGTLSNGGPVQCPAGQWTRVSHVVTAPPGGTRAQVRFYVWSGGTTVGETVDVDAVLIEQAGQVLPYFDGSTTDTLEAVNAWTGAEYASTSTQGPGVGTGVLVPVQLYTFVGGVRKQIKPMYAHGGVLETE